MKPAARLVAPVLVGLLAACGGADQAEAERATAVDDVLGGSINDEMLPLDTVTSQSPPLREQASGTGAGSAASASSDADDDDQADDPAPVADEAPAPEAAAEPEADSEE